jgi:PAS domain S-box-containing protein
MQQSVRIAPLTAGDEVVGTITLIDDVTERVAREDELKRQIDELEALQGGLRNSEARYRVLAEQSLVGVYVLAGERFRYVNAALAGIFGYAPNEFIDQIDLRALVCADDWAAVQAQLERATADPAAHLHIQFCGQHKDGSLRWIELFGAQAIYDDRPAILGTLIDISARVRTEEDQRFLAEASTLLATSLDDKAILADLAEYLVPRLADVCVIDMQFQEGRLERVATAATPENAAYQDLLRPFAPALDKPHPAIQAMATKTAEILGHIPAWLIDAVAQDQDHAAVMHRLGMHSALFVPVLFHDTALGVITLISTQAERRYTQADLNLTVELARRVALAVENAQLYRQARQALETRDQFLSVAAHELKTPVTSLLGYAQLLQRRLTRDGNERDQRALQTITQQATRLNSLIHSLFDLSRLQTGQFSIIRAEVDLARLTRRIVEETVVSLESHPVIYQGADSGMLMEGDDLRLEQVIQNLLQNAIKYSPSGGTITLGVEPEGDQICLTVSDQGIGIPEHALPNIFTRFYRIHNDDTARLSSLGIGLFVVKEFVNLHNGTVTVHSAEGQGTTFKVCFPRLAGA